MTAIQFREKKLREDDKLRDMMDVGKDGRGDRSRTQSHICSHLFPIAAALPKKSEGGQTGRTRA
jgi:hypothetical protein